MENRVKARLMHAGIKEEEYQVCKPYIDKDNRIKLIASCVVFIFCTSLLLITCLIWRDIFKFFGLYLGSLILSIIILILAIKPLSNKHNYYLFLVYSFQFTLLGFALCMGTFLGKDTPAITYIAFIIISSLVFADRPIRPLLTIFISLLIFFPLCWFTKDWATVIIDLINVPIFGIAAMVFSIVGPSEKLKNYALAYRLKVASETDSLTGLKNRTSYDNVLSNASYFSNSTILYVDANGLHQINNEFGHAAGDALLVTIASEARIMFPLDDIFRIGGDEFVIVSKHDGEEEIKEKIAKIHEELKQKNYSVSIGYQKVTDIFRSITDVIKASEKNMYSEKERYYVENNVERRRTLM